MSVSLELHLLDKYGPRLSMDDLAKVLQRTPNTIRRQLESGALDLPLYIEGKSRSADYRDVAECLDKRRHKSLRIFQ